MRRWVILGLVCLGLGFVAFLLIPPGEVPGQPVGTLVAQDFVLPSSPVAGFAVVVLLVTGLVVRWVIDPPDAAGPRERPVDRRLGGTALLGSVCWWLVAVGASMVASRGVSHLGVSRFGLFLWSTAAVQGVFLGSGLLLVTWEPRVFPRVWRGTRGSIRACVRWGLVGYVRDYPLIFGALLANAFLLRWTDFGSGVPRALRFLLAASDVWQKVVVGVLVVLVAPVAEELFFRGLIHRIVAERLTAGYAAIVSGGVFALAHLDTTVILPLWVLGIVFARWYDRTGSLVTPMTMHLCQNGLSLVLFWTIVGG